jgi:hypothetical protein
MMSDLLKLSQAAATALNMLDQRRYEFEMFLAPRALELVIVMRCRVQVRGERENGTERAVTNVTLVGEAIESLRSREVVDNLGGRLGQCARRLDTRSQGYGWYNVKSLNSGGDLMSIDAVGLRFEMVRDGRWRLERIRAEQTIEVMLLVPSLMHGCDVLYDVDTLVSCDRSNEVGHIHRRAPQPSGNFDSIKSSVAFVQRDVRESLADAFENS